MIVMQSPEILKKRAKEYQRKKQKPSVYDLMLFQQMERPAKNKEKKFVLEQRQKLIDVNICSDSRKMKEVIDETVTLIITSPPYNVNKQYKSYKDETGLIDYLDYLDDVWKECYRVLRPGGRLCINIAGIGRAPYVPLQAYISNRLINLGFFMRGSIIWNKGASVGTSTAWGSWKNPSNPTLRDIHEFILVFSKFSNKLILHDKEISPDITRDEFLEFGKSVWNFGTANAKKIGHPSPFPEELPYRCIKLYSYPGDLVLDPLCGSGTTCLVAKNTGRHFIGYDINPEYIKLADKRII